MIEAVLARVDIAALLGPASGPLAAADAEAGGAPPLDRPTLLAAIAIAVASAGLLFGLGALRRRRSYRHRASEAGGGRAAARLHRAGKWIFAHRIHLLLPWFLPLIVLFHPARMPAFAARLALYAMILCGAALRIWSTGYRTWSFDSSGGRHLMTAGPYAFVRHPIYIANLLLGIPAFLAVGLRPLTAAFVAWYLALHLAIIAREDDALRARYGDAWTRYAAEVRALLPRIRPHGDPQGTFRWEPIIRGMEPLKMAGILGGTILCLEVFPTLVHGAASRFVRLFAGL